MRLMMMVAVLIGSIGPMGASGQPTYTVFSPKQPAAADVRQGVLISLDLKDVTVENALNQIATKTGLALMWDHDKVSLNEKTSATLRNVTVHEALSTVLRGTGTEGRLSSDGQTILVVRTRGVARERALASGTVVGRVTDSASGQGLGGAQVRVEGVKELSAVTSDSGNFTLRNVPVGDQVIVVRLFGYKPAQRTVSVTDSGRVTVRIVMVAVPTVLSGVVTTATGLQKRIAVGNDITVINADSVMQVAPVSTLTDLLATRVPGLIVQNTSGIPGAPSRLRLRGSSSILISDDPIVIVDGIRIYADQSGSAGAVPSGGGSSVVGLGNKSVTNKTSFAGPSALDQIDPNSIETVQVMKGPSATAIYGSDAANGVIIVTTKHGRVGPTRWSINTNQGRTTLPGDWPVNWYRFGHDVTILFPPSSDICQVFGVSGSSAQKPAQCVLDSLVAYQALNDPRINMLKTGWNHDASLTVSGGSGQLTYSVTGSASSQTGYLHLPDVIAQVFDSVHGFAAPGWMKNPDAYTTYGGNSSLIVQLGQSGATLALTSQLFHSAQQQNSLENDLLVLQNTYVGSGAIRVGGPIDGTLGRAQATTLTSLFPDFYNKVQLNTITFSNALTLTNWSPWHWLPINATAGLSVRNTDNSTLLPRDYILGAFLGDFALSGAGGDTIGGYAFNRGSNTTQTLNASTTLASWQRVSTSIGINVNSSSASSFGAQTTGLPIGVSVPTSFIYTNGTGPSQSVFNSATYGWYVAPTLHLNDRFFASPGFRLDGGTGSGTHGGFSGGALSLFPKLDVSYVAVNRQPSDPMFGVLTLLRPRIAFGIAGVNPGPTETLRFLTPSDINPTVGGGTGIPIDVLNATTIGNTQLHPERSREFEGGADAQFWNNRLGITLTAYDKMRYDAIENIPVAPSIFTIGNASSYYANIGTVRNTGLEATITARLLDSRAVQWNINGNVSHNDNKFVKSTFQGGKVIVGIGEGTQNIDVPGYPLNSVWARPILGFDDSNSDGVIESNEVRLGDSVVYVGAQIPNYELTLNTSLGFFNNRLTVNTSIDVQDGLTQVMTPAGAGNECRDGSSCVYNQLNNPNTTLAQQAAFAAFSSGIGSGTGIGFVQTVNTLRWGTVSVNYVVPPAVSNFFRVHTMSIALQGSNLGLWTNYRGKDPNVNAFSSGNSTVDSGQLPRPRLWSLNFRLGN